MYRSTCSFIWFTFVSLFIYVFTAFASQEEIQLQAHTRIFHEHLKKLRQELEQHKLSPTIFICFASHNEHEEIPHLNTLAHDLLLSGIKAENLYYKLKPGGGVSVHQHAARIFNVDKVIVVGSPKLKEDYEREARGRGKTTLILENLLTGIHEKGTAGIIPLWFQGEFKECFPLTFASLPSQYLGKDYFTSFFDLLDNLYALPNNQTLLTYKADFERKRGVIPPDMLVRYGEKLLHHQQKQAKQDKEEIEKALFTNLDNRVDEEEQKEESAIKPFRSWQPVTTDPSFFPVNNLPDRPEEFIESKPHEGSKSYLDLLWQELHERKSTTISSSGRSSLTGMGGVGKTTLALQYAYEALWNKAYHCIYWLTNETEFSLMEGYRSLLKALNIVYKEDDTQDNIIRLIKQYLPTKGRSLLIYDNVPQPKFLLNKTPQTETDIIITSRCNQGWGKSIISLDVFRPEEAEDYLLKTTGLEASEENKHQASILAKELGYLPLALTHAASYIKFVGGDTVSSKDIESYINDFKKEGSLPQNLLSPLPEVTHEHLIAKTWSLSGKVISPLARELMTYFAYLDPESIEGDLFKSEKQSDKDLKEAFAQLRLFSLIKQNEKAFSIHRLVQLVIRQEQEREMKYPQAAAQKTSIEELLNLLVKKAPSLLQKRKIPHLLEEEVAAYFPHILKILEHAKQLGVINQQFYRVEWLGRTFHILLAFMNEEVFIGRQQSKKGHREDTDKSKHLLKEGEKLFSNIETKSNRKAFEWLLEISETASSSIQSIIGYFLHLENDQVKAFDRLQKASDNRFAQYLIGLMYLQGIKVEKNYDKSQEWFERAANNNYSFGQFGLGLVSKKRKDLTQAIMWYTKAAEQGNSQAQYALAKIYEEEKNDPTQATIWYTKAVSQNEKESSNTLKRLTKKGNTKAFEGLRQAAEEGNSNAQSALGEIYEEGEKKDLTQAIMWYTKAAFQNDWESQCALGRIAKEGNDKALEGLTQAAEQGNIEAQFVLAQVYEKGKIKDLDQAFMWYKKSTLPDDKTRLKAFKRLAQEGSDKALQYITETAEKGNSTAQCTLGEIYRKEKKDLNQAIMWYTRAALLNNQNSSSALKKLAKKGIQQALESLTQVAEQGNSEVQYTLAKLYEKEEKNGLDQAIMWYTRAALQNEYESIEALVRLTVKGNVKALDGLIQAAEKGKSSLKYRVSEIYLWGLGPKQSIKTAIEWFIKVVQQGNSRAYQCLGALYGGFLAFNDLELDYSKALEWLGKGVEKEDKDSFYWLGKMYSKGLGVKHDQEQAQQYFKKAFKKYEDEVKQRNELSKYNLGIAYFFGEGAEKNKERAFQYFDDAASMTHTTAKAYLGRFYKEGIGTKKDVKETFKWIEESANQNDYLGQYNLGLLYRDGEGVEQNDAEAVKWFRKSADRGFPEACYSLGWMYEKGRGVEKNNEEASQWYKRGEKGHAEDALYSIGRIYEYGLGKETPSIEEALKWYQRAADLHYEPAIEKVDLLKKGDCGNVRLTVSKFNCSSSI